MELAPSERRRLSHAGLGPLAADAHADGLITDRLAERIVVLNDTRKVMAHFKTPLDPRGVLMRLKPLAADTDAEEYDATVAATLREDAELALEVSTEVLRGVGLNDPSYCLVPAV
jgi:hypothetical protein